MRRSKRFLLFGGICLYIYYGMQVFYTYVFPRLGFPDIPTLALWILAGCFLTLFTLAVVTLGSLLILSLVSLRKWLFGEKS